MYIKYRIMVGTRNFIIANQLIISRNSFILGLFICHLDLNKYTRTKHKDFEIIYVKPSPFLRCKKGPT